MTCQAVTLKGLPCTAKAQGNGKYCGKHYRMNYIEARKRREDPRRAEAIVLRVALRDVLNSMAHYDWEVAKMKLKEIYERI